MRRYLILALWGIIALVLETTVFESWSFLGIKPDIILILIILFALINGPREGMLAAFFLGGLEALILARFVGAAWLAKVLCGLLVGYGGTKLYRDNFLVAIIVVLVGTFFYAHIYYLTAPIFHFRIHYPEIISVVPVLAVYNTALIPLIYFPFYRSNTKGLLRETYGIYD